MIWLYCVRFFFSTKSALVSLDCFTDRTKVKSATLYSKVELSKYSKLILTGWLAILPLGKLDIGLLPLDGVNTQFWLQSPPQHLRRNVGVLDVAKSIKRHCTHFSGLVAGYGFRKPTKLDFLELVNIPSCIPCHFCNWQLR